MFGLSTPRLCLGKFARTEQIQNKYNCRKSRSDVSSSTKKRRSNLNWNLLEIKLIIEWWAAFHVYIISKTNFKLKVETFLKKGLLFKVWAFNLKVYGIYFNGLSQKCVPVLRIVKTEGGLSEVVTGEELGWFISGACVAPVWGPDSWACACARASRHVCPCWKDQMQLFDNGHWPSGWTHTLGHAAHRKGCDAAVYHTSTFIHLPLCSELY